MAAFHRLVRLGIRRPWDGWAPLGAAAAGTLALSSAVLKRRQAHCDSWTPPRPLTSEDGDWSANPTVCSDASALWQRAWHADWDGRAPPTGPDAKEVKTKGKVRHLIFIRHGQYDLDSDDHGLTELGREQSRLLGQRLAAEARGVRKDRYGEVKVNYAGIWVSNLLRAQQTAEILAANLPGVPLQEPDPLLAEGKPTVPHPCSKGSSMRPADIWAESARMEAGFRKYVHREVDHKRLAEKQAKKDKEKKKELGDGYNPSSDVGTPKSAGSSEAESGKEPEHVYEIYVCHMNLIRYFVMRALQLPPEAWLRLRGDNTGITEITVNPNGRVSLYRFADVGHLPIEMVTFH